MHAVYEVFLQFVFCLILATRTEMSMWEGRSVSLVAYTVRLVMAGRFINSTNTNLLSAPIAQGSSAQHT